MAHILRLMQDGNIRHISNIIPLVCERAQLTEEQVTAIHLNGEGVAANRIRWGCWYFFQAGIFDRPARATYQITALGRNKAVEWQDLDAITLNYFVGLPDWEAQRENLNERDEQQSNEVEAGVNPEENDLPDILDLQAVTTITENAAQKLLERLRNVNPEFFEKMVIQALFTMNYNDREKFFEHLEYHDDGINDATYQDLPDMQNFHGVKMKIQRADYASLNARQKEHYNFAKVAGFLCEYGFHAIRLSDDWNGADFLALHKDKEITLKVQLKSACGIYKKYLGKDIYLAFPAVTNGESERKWYLLSHDLLICIVGEHTRALETGAWIEGGFYHFPSLSQQLSAALQNYRIDNNADYLTPGTWKA